MNEEGSVGLLLDPLRGMENVAPHVRRLLEGETPDWRNPLQFVRRDAKIERNSLVEELIGALASHFSVAALRPCLELLAVRALFAGRHIEQRRQVS